jgi:long-chain acyl-CoA synthetase
MGPPGALRVGTVGRPLPGVEVRIADDGEILTRGANVTVGYYLDDAGTAELLDADGWMHTGDLGALDIDGYLSITGRKKDLIINASGKNISPQEIETRLRYEPLISQAVVIGDGRPYLTALLTLDSEAVLEWAGHHSRSGTIEALTSDPDVLREVGESVDRVNLEHARVEGIKRWHVLPHDLTVAGGELTPTLKVKRGVVAEKYADAVDALYAR